MSVSVSGCVVCQQAGGLSVLTSTAVCTAVCQCPGVLCVKGRRNHCVLTSTALCQFQGVLCVNRQVESLCVNEYCSVSVPMCVVCQQTGGLCVNEYCSVSVSGYAVCQQTGGLSVSEYCSVSVSGCCVSTDGWTEC